MMVSRALGAWVLAGCCALLAAGCDDDAPLVLVERGALAGIGSARIDLPLGSLRGGTGTLVLSGEPDFESQTRQLQLTGADAQRSVFFGSLPAGIRYRLELLAGDCRGDAEFGVEANRTTQVELQLSCVSPAPQQPSSSLPSPMPPEPGPPALPPGDPDCALIAEIVAEPPLQSGNTATSTIDVVLLAGVKSSAVEWSLMEASRGVGLLFSSPTSGLAVGFDCERDGVAGIVASVSGTRDGKTCRQQGQTQISCVQGSPALKPPVAPPPPAGPGACGACSRDYCAAQLAAAQALPEAEPVLSCVLGSGWSAGERASAESCGNSDLLACYCGSTPELVCEQAAPAELDGPCLDAILSGTGCEDSSCVRSTLLEPTHPGGAALSYVRCQQDYCYDLCFNS